MRLCAPLITAIAISVLASAPQSASATDGDMSIERAGRYYLNTVCAANKVDDRFYEKVFGEKSQLNYKDYKGKVLKAARQYGRKSSNSEYRASRRLANPPAPWPAGIADRVDRMSANYLNESDQFDRVVNKPRRKSFDALVELESLATVGVRDSKRIRSFLDLPKNGRGC